MITTKTSFSLTYPGPVCKRSFRQWSSAFVSLFLLSGCATVNQLNDPATSQPGADVATTKSSDTRLFETRTSGGIALSYNITASNSSDMTLRLVIRNMTNERQIVTPRLALSDGSGIRVPLHDYMSRIALAAAAANQPIPQTVVATAPSYYHTGTVRNISTGAQYDYSGTSRPAGGGFAQGFAQGQALGAAMAAAAERRDAREYMDWISAHWLKASYELEPGAAVAGIVTFPGSLKNLRLPLTVNVRLDNNRSYDFRTISSLQR